MNIPNVIARERSDEAISKDNMWINNITST